MISQLHVLHLLDTSIKFEVSSNAAYGWLATDL